MVVFPHDKLTSIRTLPSWALLAFAAGAVNMGAFLACQRFVAHVTGALTMVSADTGLLLGADYLLVMLCFVLGAGGAVVLVRKFGRPARLFPYWIPLTIVSVALTLVAVLGHMGVFGQFSGSIEGPHDLALLCILSVAMGMQNAAVATSTDNAVRTTHMTGPATDFAVAAATLIVGRADERTKAWRSVALRGTKLLSFAMGTLLMVPLCRRFGFLAFIVPATACAIATLSSYAPRRFAQGLTTEGGTT